MRDAHHCSGPPGSEMTYTVSRGTLNSTIPYHTIPYYTRQEGHPVCNKILHQQSSKVFLCPGITWSDLQKIGRLSKTESESTDCYRSQLKIKKIPNQHLFILNILSLQLTLTMFFIQQLATILYLSRSIFNPTPFPYLSYQETSQNETQARLYIIH